MPRASAKSASASQGAEVGLRNTMVGQLIEFIPDRVYLASYTEPPTDDTLFPELPSTSRTPSKRAKTTRKPPFYFTVDDSLLYNAFHHDFGPLHIGHLYRFALYFHELLAEIKDRPIVFWSAADPRSRANATCLIACYMVLVQRWPPHLAIQTVAQIDPPLMPFRDAGYSQADYGITVQDVVYGVWRAKEEKVLNLEKFDLDSYEMYEKVENGDFNWITPHFLAFASPMFKPVAPIPETSELYKTLPRNLEEIVKHETLPDPFKHVLAHFSENNIGLVVRLNSHLYSPTYFEALGIQHLDMIFEDGTCPPMKVVRKFLRLANDTIYNKKKSIAVHCKAGLGRTGCLIGAYLIYRHGFTANEVISYMRFMRPGMVVGPQQHWLHLKQHTFREWWAEERATEKIRRELAAASAVGAPTTPLRAIHKTPLRNGQVSTPPNRSTSNRTPLSEVDDRNNIGHEDYLPAPTPGQPRKSAKVDRHHPYNRSTAAVTHHTTVEEETGVEQETEIVSVHRQSFGAESDEEIHLRVRAHRRPSQSRGAPSPTANRSVSHQATRTTTTTVYSSLIDSDPSQDVENVGPASPSATTKKPLTRVASTPVGSGAATLAKIRGAAASARRQADSPSRPKDAVAGGGVRKTSGRMGSVGATQMSATARKVSGA